MGSFLLVLLAWFLFGVGSVNLFGEACQEGHRRVAMENLEGGWSSFRDILMALFRLAFMAVCFSGWWWLLFR